MPDDAPAESLQVSAELEAEFQKALQHQLTDEDIEQARLLLGIDVASRHRELNSVATPDAIRNWALGVGDDNPLYIDEEYGPATRWGTQIGHGTQVGPHQDADARRPDPRRDQGSRPRACSAACTCSSRAARGTGTGRCAPATASTRFRGEESLDVKQSEFAGRSVIQVRRDVAINQFGEVLGVYRILRVLTERKESREKGKYAEIEPAHYTDDDYERIDAIYEPERPRGAETRYWEDVERRRRADADGQGPDSPITEMIAFHAGGYGFVPYGLRSSRVGYKNRQRIAPFYVKNEHGVWDVAQRLHWDSEWAKAIGNPMAYDYGVLRQCWFYHHVVRLGRRRRLHRADRGLDPQVQLHGRHAVPVRRGGRQARGGRPEGRRPRSCT